jgi:SAM-dependent methyltransferase
MRRASSSLHHEVWSSLGATDPDWAVLTDPSRRHGGWGPDLDAFYATGRTDIAEVLAALPPEAGLGKALDWGSGTGRLSFALLDQFQSVTAVDVSPPMLATLMERADELGLANRVTPELVADLRPDGTHDVAVSLLVLQHLSSRAEVATALSSIVTCVTVGGYLVLELPEHPVTTKARLQPRFHAYRVLRALGMKPATLHRHGLSGISMLCLSRAQVTFELALHGAETIGVPRVRSDGAHSYVRYVARRMR